MNLHDACIPDADLRGAELRGALLIGTSLENVVLFGATPHNAFTVVEGTVKDEETAREWR